MCAACRCQKFRYCLAELTLAWPHSAHIKGAQVSILLCEDCQQSLTATIVELGRE